MNWSRSFLGASWKLDFSEQFPAMRWFGCCLDVSGRVLEGGCQRMLPAMYSLCLCLEVSWRVLEFNFLARAFPALRWFSSCPEVSLGLGA